MNLVLLQLELCLTAYVAHRSKKLQTPKKLIEEIDSPTVAEVAPRCPTGKFKMHVRVRDARVQNSISLNSGVKVGTSPAMKTEGTTFVSQSSSLVNRKSINDNNKFSVPNVSNTIMPQLINQPLPPLTTSTPAQSANMSLRKRTDTRLISTPSPMTPQLVQTSLGRHIILTPSSSGTTTVVTQSGQRLTVVKSTATQQRNGTPLNKPIMKVSPLITNVVPISNQYQQTIAVALAQQLKNHSYSSSSSSSSNAALTNCNDLNQQNANDLAEASHAEFLITSKEELRKDKRIQKLHFIAKTNHRRCEATPIYGSDLRHAVVNLCSICQNSEHVTPWSVRSYVHCQHSVLKKDICSLALAIKSYQQRAEEMQTIFSNFVIYVPAVSAPEPYLHISHPHPSKLAEETHQGNLLRSELSPRLSLLHPIISAMNTQVRYLISIE